MTIIKNIGYMWHRKYVDWNDKPHLYGYSEWDDSKKVDFAFQSGIYTLYNQNSECIYVGQAGRGDQTGLFHRLKTHALDNELFCMWQRFTWYGFYSVETIHSDSGKAYEDEFKIKTNINELMNVIESMIIRTAMPQFNKSVGSLKKDKETIGIEWFYQKAQFEEWGNNFDELKRKCDSLKED